MLARNAVKGRVVLSLSLRERQLRRRRAVVVVQRFADGDEVVEVVDAVGCVVSKKEKRGS